MDEQTTKVIESVIEMATGYGLQVVGAIVVLIVGRIAAGWVRGAVRKSLERAEIDTTLTPFFSTGVYYAVLGAVLIAVLNLFGIQTTSLVAAMGAAGLAVGLALQGTLANFAAGVMLLIFRPIRVGDFVEVSGAAGTVV